MPGDPDPDIDLGAALDDFFAERPEARALFELVRAALEDIGPTAARVTKSQVAFTHRRGFAWAWTPDRYLRGDTAPLVLSVALPARDLSPRWKEVVEPLPGRWMHHLELHEARDLDAEVRAWLRQAWEAAR